MRLAGSGRTTGRIRDAEQTATGRTFDNTRPADEVAARVSAAFECGVTLAPWFDCRSYSQQLPSISASLPVAQRFEEVSRFGSQAQELAVQHLRQHNEVVRTKMDVLSRKNEAFRNEIFRLRRTFGAE